MSPALLTKRLRELEEAGIVARRRTRRGGTHEYQLTAAGKELGGVIESIGTWGQRWIDGGLSLENLDPTLLMWDMRRNLDPRPLPRRRCVIQFIHPDLQPARRNFWLVVEPDGGVDLCLIDPGYDIDLYVTTDVRTMTAVWMGLARLRDELAARRVSLAGNRGIGAQMERWLGYSHFAGEPKVGKLRLQ
jgi:HxlR-like helix-turn-helix